jgi:putative flavoprotein involved in K+ transport
MTVTQLTSVATTYQERAAAWLQDFENALTKPDPGALHELFADDSHWRDIAAFTWDVVQFSGLDRVATELQRSAAAVVPVNFALDADRPAPGVSRFNDHEVVEAFFTFETQFGRCAGLAYFVEEDARASHGLRAYVLSTVLRSLHNVVEKHTGEPDPGYGFTPEWPGQTWTQYRARQVAYEDREPEVLVVGGGQAGICTAALLDNLGVDTLVIDKFERAGDSWRTRYEALNLHSPTTLSDFPFIPYPKTFPKYLPRDKHADWVEAYVKLLDLNYWTSSTFVDAVYDDSTQRWTARIERGDGSMRVLRPAHIVMSVGGSGGRPLMPAMKGIDTFRGTVVHSSQFTSGRDYRSSKALVVGVGTSAHDIALDLYRHGADVAMLQRGPITVVSLEEANTVYGSYMTDMDQSEADHRYYAGYVYPLMVEASKRNAQRNLEVDADLLEGLANAGMKLDIGEDETGWQMKFARYAGGYYLNVGASDVVVEGGISVMQYEHVDGFVPEGVALDDGTVREFDLVVMATGYEGLEVEVERYFGTDVAERVGPVGRLGPDGERRNFCKPTPQEHLWFTFGGIVEGRRSASWMALMIKAQLDGLVPALHRSEDGKLIGREETSTNTFMRIGDA